MKKYQTNYRYILGKVEVAYDFEKLGTITTELFEIANRYRRYRNLTKKWYLKPLYGLTCFLSAFIAEAEGTRAT